MKLQYLNESYQQDPKNFRAIQLAAVNQHIEATGGSALNKHRLRCFVWSTVARLRLFEGTEPHYWFLVYNTLEQRIEKLRMKFDRIKVHRNNEVIHLADFSETVARNVQKA